MAEHDKVFRTMRAHRETNVDREECDQMALDESHDDHEM